MTVTSTELSDKESVCHVKFDIPSLCLLELAIVLALVIYMNVNEAGIFVDLLFYSAMLVAACKMALSVFDRRDVLIIDKNGFFDRRNMDVPVAWGEILLIKNQGTRLFDGVFLIRFRRPEVCLTSPQKRIFAALSRTIFSADVRISTLGLSIWPRELEKRLRASPAGKVLR